MNGGSLPANVKRTSALRRVPPLEAIRFRPECGGEGDVCAFELPRDTFPITVEAPSGRAMTIAPGDAFLATPGYRESRRWAVGSVPASGLVPGNDYWVLSDSGVVGELISYSALEMGHLGRVRYLGAVCGDRGETLNIRQFAVTDFGGTDHNAPVYLVLGTSSEVGKTTAGVAVLQSLRMQGHTTVIALKATGTPSIAEIARYQDFGAAQAFDCIDFGLPTTYPVGREEISDIFAKEVDFCLSLPAEALVVECAGDPVSANAPARAPRLSDSAALRSQDNPCRGRRTRRDGREARACGNRAHDQLDNGPVHRYADHARTNRGAVRHPRNKSGPRPRPGNAIAFVGRRRIAE